MAHKNPIAIARQLALSDKYVDNPVIHTLYTTFNLSYTEFRLVNDPVKVGINILAGYEKGLEGEDGYGSPIPDRDTVALMVVEPTKRLIYLARAQMAAECLIMALKALGEPIEY